jgi:hypothetical protein
LKIKNWENIENKSEFLYDDKLIIYKFINKENQNLKIDLKNEILKYIQNNRYFKKKLKKKKVLINII